MFVQYITAMVNAEVCIRRKKAQMANLLYAREKVDHKAIHEYVSGSGQRAWRCTVKIHGSDLRASAGVSVKQGQLRILYARAPNQVLLFVEKFSEVAHRP